MIRRHLSVGATVAVVGFVGLFVGTAPISPSEVWGALGAGLGFGEATRVADGVVWDIRMPRIIGAIVVGGSLGAAGTGLQGVFRNPIAEPYLLGLSSAAGFGLVVGAWMTATGAIPVVPAVLAVVGVGGAAIVLKQVATLARDGNALVLSGLAIGFALLAWTLLLIFGVDSPRLPTFTYFVFGGLGATTWKVVAVGTVLAIAGIGLIASRSRDLDLIALGDVQAGSLGVDVPATTRTVLIGTALAVGAAVSIGGVVGFIGLLGPLLGRRLVGPSHRGLIWAAVGLGMGLVLLADIGIRALAAPVEVPLGVVTAAVGGPVLIVLLLRGRAT